MNLNECTYKKTGKNYALQFWRHCFTCFKDLEEGACLNCASICHAGHALGPIKKGNFFCDCGANNCRNITKSTFNPPTIPSLKPVRFLTPIAPRAPPTAYVPYIPSTKIRPCDYCTICKDIPTVMNYMPTTCTHGATPEKPYTGPSMFGNYLWPTKSVKTYGKPVEAFKTNSIGQKIFNKLQPGRIISPASIGMALGLIQIAAHDNTHRELTDFMSKRYTFNELKQLYGSINSSKSINIANAFFIRPGFPINPNYIKAVQDIMKTEIGIDAGKINKYIEKKTNGMIKNIVGRISVDTKAILVNTIYFKSDWKSSFKKKDTYIEDFYINNLTLPIKMMHQTTTVKYYEDAESQLIEMDYKDPDVVMGFVLPKDPSKKFGQFDWRKFWPSIGQLNKERISITIPKFKIKKKTNLVNIMKNCGVNDLFNDQKCNIAGISKDLFVSDIIHEAVVEVDEKGTEAAAATAIFLTRECAMTEEKTKTFKANHPFYFYIRHKSTDSILFFGDYIGSLE